VEFVAGGLDVAQACVRRLQELGTYEFNAVGGEERRFLLDGWVSGEAMLGWLEAGAGDRSSGDLYARLAGGRSPVEPDPSVLTTPAQADPPPDPDRP
jgi:hypothetical protein